MFSSENQILPKTFKAKKKKKKHNYNSFTEKKEKFQGFFWRRGKTWVMC